MSSPVGPHSATAAELKQRLEAERLGDPFLILREASGGQRLIALQADRSRVTVGRSEDCDVALVWDGRVSRVHAELEKIGPRWAVSDGGLSRNGTYLNGERVTERRRLQDGDTLRFGATVIVYREPSAAGARAASTVFDLDRPNFAHVSPAQKVVLEALCQPFAEAGLVEWARPATNQEIAQELVLSLDAVKGHLRVLFAKFGVESLPQNEKRLRLAERALHSGAVSLPELRRKPSP